MTLSDLIKQTPLADILRECELLDAHNGARAYERVLEKLEHITPAPADFAIMISPWIGDSTFHDISGVMEGDPQSHPLDFTAWEEWLSAEVRVKDLDLTPAQMVAQCLYEMTFFSFDQDEIQELKDDIGETVEQIKRDHEEDL